jgi:transposase-like protein/IS1 family transposase
LVALPEESKAKMTCHNCRLEMVKAGFFGKCRVQRWKCQECAKRFSEPQQKPFGADVRLPREKVCMILNCLVEGNSVRGTARLCDVEKRTVLNILTLAGEACERLFEKQVRNVRVHDLELDEVWTYVGCHQKRLTPERIERGMVGDAYTFIGLERTSKLVVAWHLGKRDRVNTEDFISKIRWATAPGWFDVSTDAFQPYETAIDAGLYDRANYSQVVKLFSNRLDRVSESYSPARFVCVQKDAVSGRPDLDRAGTSHVERKNGTLRQWCKRLTRLTYAFSKKWENLKAALALHFAHYNFCRVHGSLRITPAMAAGITDRVWAIEDLISTL